MCWYLWVLIGSFSQQAQSQITPELNMQPGPAQGKTYICKLVCKAMKSRPWSFKKNEYFKADQNSDLTDKKNSTTKQSIPVYLYLYLVK